MNQEKFHALALDPELPTRIRLKQACASVPTFGRFSAVNTAEEAHFKLTSVEAIDVVFISNRFDREAISQFIKQAKTTRWGQDACFVMMLSGKEQDTASVARAMFAEADGMLFEPYSVESLVEITKMAAQVKKEREDERAVAAMRFFVSEIIDLVSVIAHVTSRGMEGGEHRRKLRELCGAFATMDEEARRRYFIMAVDMFEAVPNPKPAPDFSYKGASTRIKKRLEEKVLAHIKGVSDQQ